MISRFDWLPSAEAKGCYRDTSTLASSQSSGKFHLLIGKWAFCVVEIHLFMPRLSERVSNAHELECTTWPPERRSGRSFIFWTEECGGQKGFPKFSIIETWGQMILCWGRKGGCPVHFWVFSSIPGLYALDTKHHPHPKLRQ